MCGIAGQVRFDGTWVEPSELRIMAGMLHHRGPDGAGISLLDRGRVGLAHTRLSIIDLDHGHQPLYNEDGSVCISFNGEIYDYQTLRAQLEEKGHRFRTRSDTEVLVHLWEDHGPGFLDYFDGEFAFLIWDSRRRILAAARDRSGVKPLFYHLDDRGAAFCSEIKGLHVLPSVPRAFDSGYLQALGLGLYPRAGSPFQGIKSLPPGHILTLSPEGEHSLSPYWKLSYRTREDLSFADAVEETRTLIRDAVRKRLVADVPVSVYLSGGIDSSYIAGLMAASGSRHRAFHLSFSEDESLDESGLASRTAAHLGFEFVPVEIGMGDLARYLEKTLWHTELPLWNLHSVAKALLSRFASSQGAKVNLTGEGADEAFAGYPYFNLEALQQTYSRGSLDALDFQNRQQVFHEKYGTSEGILWGRWNRWASSPLTGELSYHLTRAAENRGLMSKVFLNSRFGREQDLSALMADMAGGTPSESFHPLNFSRMMGREVMHHYIIPTLGDRVELGHGVECRTPFLDRKVMEFTGSLPPSFLIDPLNFQEKRVLREAAREIVPDFIYTTPKKPFLMPTWREFYRTSEGRDLFETWLSPRELEKTGLFEPSYLNTYFRFWKSQDRNSPQMDLLMGMTLSVQLLRHLFLDQRPVLPAGQTIVDYSPIA